jgi:hypothetical protein
MVAAARRDVAEAEAAAARADEVTRLQARLRATRDDLAAGAFEVRRLRRLALKKCVQCIVYRIKHACHALYKNCIARP